MLRRDAKSDTHHPHSNATNNIPTANKMNVPPMLFEDNCKSVSLVKLRTGSSVPVIPQHCVASVHGMHPMSVKRVAGAMQSLHTAIHTAKQPPPFQQPRALTYR
jgi:hypothetical protein